MAVRREWTCSGCGQTGSRGGSVRPQALVGGVSLTFHSRCYELWRLGLPPNPMGLAHPRPKKPCGHAEGWFCSHETGAFAVPQNKGRTG